MSSEQLEESERRKEFTAFVAVWNEPLRRKAVAFAGESGGADLLQETLKQLWEEWKNRDRSKSLVALAYTILRNKFVSRWRKAKPERLKTDNASFAIESAVVRPDETDSDEDIRAFYADLAFSLPEKLAKVISALRDSPDNFDRAAANYGCSTVTFRGLRRQLSEWLKAKEVDEGLFMQVIERMNNEPHGSLDWSPDRGSVAALNAMEEWHLTLELTYMDIVFHGTSPPGCADVMEALDWSNHFAKPTVQKEAERDPRAVWDRLSNVWDSTWNRVRGFEKLGPYLIELSKTPALRGDPLIEENIGIIKELHGKSPLPPEEGEPRWEDGEAWIASFIKEFESDGDMGFEYRPLFDRETAAHCKRLSEKSDSGPSKD
jgi:DNA-directed RNA polymerase specialized sigma24 family protein